MNNLTHYADNFLLELIQQVDANQHKCTANIQLDSNYVPFLNIWEEIPMGGWDYDEHVVFSQAAGLIDLCDEMDVMPSDVHAMTAFWYYTEPSPDPVHDEELFMDELLADAYYAELLDDYYETLRDAMPNCYD